MSSFRELLKESSGLGEGIAVRDHLNALGSGVGGSIVVTGIEVIVEDDPVVVVVEDDLIMVDVSEPDDVIIADGINASVENSNVKVKT